MTDRKRVTLKEIAQQAGVHHTTVSLALRNRPELPLETRLSLQKLAEEMGYRPDPALSALRARHRSTSESGYSIALVTTANRPTVWRENDLHRTCHDGIVRRAAQLGYHFEDFWYDRKSMSKQRVTRILRTRNISGLLISGHGPLQANDLEWEHFACVSMTQSLPEIPIHVVTSDHSFTIRRALRELLALKYKRIGFVMDQFTDRHLQGVWSTGFLGEQAMLPIKQRVPIHLPEKLTVENFRAWRERHTPDVILSIPPNLEFIDWLKRDGFRVPDDIGIASLDCSSNGEISGIYQNTEVLGMLAVDTVAGLIHRNDLGLPQHPTEVLMRGTWIGQRTTRLQS
jgi:LacI family transcriptional regulator